MKYTMSIDHFVVQPAVLNITGKKHTRIHYIIDISTSEIECSSAFLLLFFLAECSHTFLATNLNPINEPYALKGLNSLKISTS